MFSASLHPSIYILLACHKRSHSEVLQNSFPTNRAKCTLKYSKKGLELFLQVAFNFLLMWPSVNQSQSFFMYSFNFSHRCPRRKNEGIRPKGLVVSCEEFLWGMGRCSSVKRMFCSPRAHTLIPSTHVGQSKTNCESRLWLLQGPALMCTHPHTVTDSMQTISR